MSELLKKQCKKASEIILSTPEGSRIRVISHYDADGITSAAIICKALHRAGFEFHATLMRNPFDKGLKRVSKEENKLIIFCDMGSGQIETIENMNCKSIIVDHHQYKKEKTKENVFQINANLCKINGNYEACGATLTYELAKLINEDNKDLAYLAVIGATGDKQYIGGFKGYNKELIQNALKEELISEKNCIKLNGKTIHEALYYSVEPFYSKISGDKQGIKALLTKLDIPFDIKPSDLSKEQSKKLNSYLMLKLVEKGCEKNILDTVIRNRYFSDKVELEFEAYADLLDSCGKGGNRGIGLSAALGDKNAFEEAIDLEKEFKQKLLDELIRLENEGFKEKSFRYFYCTDSSLGGVIGGIATNFLLDKEKPLLSIVRNKNEIHVSCRGNQYLVAKGLDLGFAMSEAAKKLNGHGGGHAIASGATISLEKEEEFLSIVDDIIKKQIGE